MTISVVTHRGLRQIDLSRIRQVGPGASAHECAVQYDDGRAIVSGTVYTSPEAMRALLDGERATEDAVMIAASWA